MWTSTLVLRRPAVGLAVLVVVTACADVPPRPPRAPEPEPQFHGLFVEDHATYPPSGDLLALLRSVRPSDLPPSLHVSGSIVVSEEPVLDVSLTPGAWSESLCARFFSAGCFCTLDAPTTLYVDLETCPGDDLTGRLKLTFSLELEDTEQGPSREAVVDVAVDGFSVDHKPLGLTRGSVRTSDGRTFTTVAPFTAPNAPMLPERARMPPAPQKMPPYQKQPSSFEVAYRGIFWLLKAAGCVARSRC